MSESFNNLKKASKKDSSALPEVKLAILGDSATQYLAAALKGKAFFEGISLLILDSDYDQIELQVRDPSSELYTFAPDIILLSMCTEKLYSRFGSLNTEDRMIFSETMMEIIKSYWSAIRENSRAPVIQFNFPEYDDRVFGSYGFKMRASFIFQLRKLNYLLAEACADSNDIFPVDISFLQNIHGRDAVSNTKLYYIAKMSLITEVLPDVAALTVDVIKALKGVINKCVVVDLDNTIWGGVIGDDGIDGIELGEFGNGPAFTALQAWLKELRNRGIILGVCSKNNEDTAKEPFEKHPEMILRPEDISIFVANWQNKDTNIRYIQQTLNIGMDSIVFLDDNPFERDLVRNAHPEITVPELPEDPAEYVSYISSLNLFETASYSETDKTRAEQYRAEAIRAELMHDNESFEDYLKKLNMTAEAKPFDSFHFPRIAQLTQRSNQFNLRTIRYTESDIEGIAADPGKLSIYFTMCDKFGDYGLVSVVILDIKPDQSLFIDTWLMSCRVLKRGMEEFIVNRIIACAKENGFTKVVGEYIPTAKNSMTAKLYEQMGFTPIGDGMYEVKVEEYSAQKTFVTDTINA